MQSGISRLVYYTTETSTGHRGSSTDELWKRHGIDIERVAFDYDEYERLYGGTNT